MNEKKWYQDKRVLSLIVLAIAATAFVTYLLLPSKVITQSQTILVADTGKIAEKQAKAAEKKYDALFEEIGWIKKILKLSIDQKPVDGGVTNPQTPPINTLPADTNKKAEVYPYDLPISGTISKSKITFYTLNPWLRNQGLPYMKTYEFDRLTTDFSFSVSETRRSDYLDGIKLRGQERFFSFDGIAIGAGALFPKEYYALIEIKFSMYERLHLSPRVVSTPAVGIELKYDIIK
jgi:hypothetical protein